MNAPALAELRRAVERLSGINLDRALDAALMRDFALAEEILAAAAVRRAVKRRALARRPRAVERAC